ncbi:transcriptional regulator [Mycolicibacter engbaekii]|uniref:Transcriptional regulator n=1 Tax=Mycolicibacter engbaekii TaxID=188915 RepID=A0A1X1TMN4_9MYCO|nr:LuxR family transcriptional regulator [Mycolicibacter engbaekii]ORV45793.1 transcriptional regulator [Mycolicibacter engbaekii]
MGSTTLIGRQDEQRQLAQLCGRARAGKGGVLVINGEAGIGKSALLAEVVAQADGLRTVWISGAETEMELAYAGVQQVCGPILAHIAVLPDPQRSALRIALGLGEGTAPDRLLVSLAVLSLLAEAGAERPTACIIDDAQWVDRASLQALTFAARRLLADPAVMIFATRVPGAPEELAGLPELTLTRLAHADAGVLLSQVMPGRLDERVRKNILGEADGNPLALLDLRQSIAPTALAGGYGLPAAASIAGRIEREYSQRLHTLPPTTQTLLLIAAAEPTGDPTWLWAAAEKLRVGADAAVPAERSGLVTVESRLRFRHPLVRSAVYHYASASQRRQVHAALADVISGPTHTEHRAWHHAHATPTPDESVAVELVVSAQRARCRGGAAAAAAFLAYAVELTPDPLRRADRALEAARAKLDAGDPEAAIRLLSAVDRADDELLSARADLLRANVAFATRRGRDAPPLLLAAARKLRPLDPVFARDAYLGALMATMIVGRLCTGEAPSAATIVRSVRQLPPRSGPATAADLFLEGIVLRIDDGHAAAAPVLQRAIQQYLAEDNAGVADPRLHDITLRVLLDLFAQDTYNSLNARQLELLRAAGELTVLPAALTTYAGVCVTAGDFAQAADLLAQAETISAATGAPQQRSIHIYLAACRGQQARAEEIARTTVRDATARGEGSEITLVLFSLAVLYNGIGNYEKALEQCSAAMEYDDIGMYGHLLNETVEAAVRAGSTDVAETAAAQLIERSRTTPTATALGYAARAKALTADGPAAENEYRIAIRELGRSPLKVMSARTHLIFGEWLRRENRRGEARAELRIAHGLFAEMGSEGFTERAKRELHAAGEPLSKQHDARKPGKLTTQESYIARLAGDGYTNSEIASHLFISPRTVEWHLGRIFGKLGVTSRRELRHARE